MQWHVYLSGEIHTDWRERIAQGVREKGLPVTLLAPVTDHAASDDCGTSILGEEEKGFWKDQKGAGVNAIRTRNLIAKADVVVVRFGEERGRSRVVDELRLVLVQHGTELLPLRGTHGRDERLL